MFVAFDVDGTLIDNSDKPRHDIIDLLRWFQEHDYNVIVWSGGGKDYAKQWARKLGLGRVQIFDKCSVDVDIAVDDAMDSEKWGNERKCKVVIKV